MSLFSSPGHNFLQTGPNSEKKLKPIIQPDLVQAQMEEVRKLVSTEYVKPRECLKDYDQYSMLVSGQAERDVNSFLSQPYSFQNILAEVIRYQNLAEQIQHTSDEVTHLNLDSRLEFRAKVRGFCSSYFQ